MVHPRFVLVPLSEAAAELATVVIAAWQLVIEELWLLPDLFVLGGWFVFFGTRSLLRASRLDRLLIRPARLMRRVELEDFGVFSGNHGNEQIEYTKHDQDAQLVRMLHTRRLVILRGERMTGKSRRAYEVLRSAFPNHTLLRPSRYVDPGRAPLTKLLTAGPLRYRGRYVLWLGDIAGLIESNFDPRIVERWLATGMSRVAIATITPDDLERILDAGTPAVYALDRAVIHDVDPLSPRPHAGSVTDRYRESVTSMARVVDPVRLISTCAILGAGPLKKDQIQTMLRRYSGDRFDRALRRTLTSGTEPYAIEQDDRFHPHPALLDEIDRQLTHDLDAQLLDSILPSLPADSLLAVGGALALRGEFEHAKRALLRARVSGPAELQPAIAHALIRMYDMQEQPSGAHLMNQGGWDFDERMGPGQREQVKQLLPPKTDGTFDPLLPPEDDSIGMRLYRHTVNRAVASVATLAALDALAVTLGSVAALAIRALSEHRGAYLIDPDLAELAGYGSAVTIWIAASFGLYRADLARARVHPIVLTMALMTIIVTAGFFVAKVAFGSLTALIALFVVASIVDGLLRNAYDRLSRGWIYEHRLQPRVLILGPREDARSAAKNINSHQGRPGQAVAYLSPNDIDVKTDPFCPAGYDQYKRLLRQLHVAEMHIVDRGMTTQDKARYVEAAQGIGIDVWFVPNDDEVRLGATARVGDEGLIYVPGALITPAQQEFKRMFDRVIVITTLPVTMSIIAFYAAYSTIRRPGQRLLVPVQRVGLGETGFTMIQLRTRSFLVDGTRGTCATGRVERFFERTGLDEIVQIANVLRGEMSIVGPRPLDTRRFGDLSVEERRTLGARPGMTGRWQVSWPYGASESEMRAMDSDYLRHWHLARDIEIILRTPLAIRQRRRHLGDTEIGRRRGENEPVVA